MREFGENHLEPLLSSSKKNNFIENQTFPKRENSPQTQKISDKKEKREIQNKEQSMQSQIPLPEIQNILKKGNKEALYKLELWQIIQGLGYKLTDKKTIHLFAKWANVPDDFTLENNLKIKEKIIDAIVKGEGISLNFSGKDYTDDLPDVYKNMINAPKIKNPELKDFVNALGPTVLAFLKNQGVAVFKRFIDILNQKIEKYANTSNQDIVKDLERKMRFLERIERDIQDFCKKNNIQYEAYKTIAIESMPPKDEKGLSLDDFVGEQITQKARVLKDIKNSEEYKAIPQNEKKEFDQITQDIYKKSKEYGFESDIKSVRGDEFYAEVEQRITIEEQENYQKIKEHEGILINSISNPEAKNYWKNMQGISKNNEKLSIIFGKENLIASLRGNENDESYKNALLAFKKIPKSYQQFFDTQGNLIQNNIFKELSKEEQAKISGLSGKKTAPETIESALLDQTNRVLKEEIISSCLTFVQDIFDIQIDENQKENLLQQFQGENQYIQDKKWTIEGQVNGQKIQLTYNLETGEISTQQGIYKEKNQQYLYVNKQSKVISGLSAPKISDFVNGANKIQYPYLVQKSEGDIGQYEKLFRQNLFAQKDVVGSLSEQKERFKKECVKNLLAQEIFETLGVKKTEQTINPQEKQQEVYGYIYDTINQYTTTDLLHLKMLFAQISQTDKIVLADNPEKTFLQYLLNSKNKNQNSADYSGMQFTDFFNLLKNPDAQEFPKAIDIGRLEVFLQRSKEFQTLPQDTGYSQSLLKDTLAKQESSEQMLSAPEWIANQN